MKILISVRGVPIGSIVTMKSDEKQCYVVRDCVKITGHNTFEKELRADDGTHFLISNNGDINVITGNTEVIWHVDPMYIVG